MVKKKLKKDFQVISFVSKKNVNAWKEVAEKWKEYFDVEPQVFDESNFRTKLKNFESIDILFLDVKLFKEWTWEDYHIFHNLNKDFKLVVISQFLNENKDKNIFKKGADDIVYLSNKQLLKWKTVSILRRFWNSYSREDIYIYKNIIADFEKDNFLLNDKKLKLTIKEISVLKLLFDNVGKTISKNYIFKRCWEYNDDIDNSRVVDQIIFKLKHKIGKEYFNIIRNKGVKFE